MSATDGKIHLGTMGMGIPVIYKDVVAKIVSSHLAIESALLKRIQSRALTPRSGQFASRLKAVVDDLGTDADDWSISACRRLNTARNKCAHIDDVNYQSLETRLMAPAEDFVSFVKSHNLRLKSHTMSDFDWACIMTYQRVYEIMGLRYDPLILNQYSELPTGMAELFLPHKT